MPDELTIRPFVVNNLSDYQALTALYKYAYPEERTTAVGMKTSDITRANEIVCRRFVAEENGIVKGIGCFEHWTAPFDRDKYLLHVIVSPQFQQRGIGSALYRHTASELEKLQPHFVRVLAQKESERSVQFALRRGFAPAILKWNVRLDVKACDLEPFLKDAEAVENDGIEIKQISQLAADFDRERKQYDLYARTMNSMTMIDEAIVPSLAEFVEGQNSATDEFTFIAVDNNQYVGMWQLENAGAGALYGGIMAVDAEYRRRGVALALAIRAIKYAQTRGYAVLTVHTDEHNKAVLRMTEKLGFTHLPAQLLFNKQYSGK